MSATFEELLKEQRATAKWIQNIISNTDKTTKKSKQTAGTFHERLRFLDEYWDDIRRCHWLLIKFADFEESDYATNDEFTTI